MNSQKALEDFVLNNKQMILDSPVLSVRVAWQAALDSFPTQWNPIETAPKDGTEILVWCEHKADPYLAGQIEKRTPYSFHCEGLAHAQDGFNVVFWVDGHTEESFGGGSYEVPACWFLKGSTPEVVANPVCWAPLSGLLKAENKDGQGAVKDMVPLKEYQELSALCSRQGIENMELLDEIEALKSVPKQEPIGYFFLNDYDCLEQGTGTDGRPLYEHPDPDSQCFVEALVAWEKAEAYNSTLGAEKTDDEEAELFELFNKAEALRKVALAKFKK